MKPVSGAGTSNALAWWPLAPTGFIGLQSTHPGSWALLRAFIPGREGYWFCPPRPGSGPHLEKEVGLGPLL